MMDHPIEPTNFKKFIGSRVQRYLLPIIPAGATLKDTSALSEGQLGKIPGRFDVEAKAWVGLARWTGNVTTDTQLRRWDAWQLDAGPIALGARTGELIPIDLDSDNAEYAAMQRRLAEKHFGVTPVVRRRDGAVRAALFYWRKPHTPPIAKRNISFEGADGSRHLTEVLGSGQHIVIEGPHAKGKMHYWESLSLVEGCGQMPEITIEQTDAYLREVAEESEAMGFTRVKMSLPKGGGDNSGAVSIDNLMSPHLAKDQELLARAIAEININDEKLADYDTWCALFRAIKAACAGNASFYIEHVWPWLAKNPANREEDMQAKWDSFKDSQLGAEYVFGWAATFGFRGGLDALAKEEFSGLTDAPAGADAGISQGDGSGVALPPVPTGPIPPGDTHVELADAFIATHLDRWRFNIERKEFFKFETATWEADPTIIQDITEMVRPRAQLALATPGPQGMQRYRALNSAGTLISIRTLLQTRKAMVMHDDEFDAQPHLLNTPDFIINLDTGETYEHAPGFLMRKQTLVTPDLAAYNAYHLTCPRWMAFLEIIADGRDWVIPFLQRWFGYCLTGRIGHQHFLFLQGLPGTGKSQLITVLLKLMASYATLLRDSFLVKSPDKRFDMIGIVGKRMGFGDETQKGSTFDETRISNVAGAETLRAEVKGGKEFDFPNHTKLILAGNHRPNFISGEAGGLMRRMLLLEITNKPIKAASRVVENFAERLVAEEGQAILMWAVEGAMLDAADTDNLIFDSLKDPMVKAAQAYTRENSLHWQWIEAMMRLGPKEELDIDLLESFELFKGYVWQSTHERSRERRGDFKLALKAMLGDKIDFATRTKGQYKGRAFIKGLGLALPIDAVGNVVDINSARKPAAADEKSEEIASPGEE